MDDHDPPATTELSSHTEWAVYQCAHGCLHVRLKNLTLTFSALEFHDLVRLLGDAYVRLSVRETVRYFGPH